MKLYLIFLLTLCSLSVKAQLFEDKYKRHITPDTCLYCGDQPAHYEKKLFDFFQWKMEHAGHGYNFRGGNMFFEVYIDSVGHPFVLSIRNRYMDYYLQDDIRRWINDDMPGWIPAMKNNHPINSTVIIAFEMRTNWLDIYYTTPDKAEKYKPKGK